MGKSIKHGKEQKFINFLLAGIALLYLGMTFYLVNTGFQVAGALYSFIFFIIFAGIYYWQKTGIWPLPKLNREPRYDYIAVSITRDPRPNSVLIHKRAPGCVWKRVRKDGM